MIKQVKILDILIILLAASVVFFAAFTVYMKPQGRTQVLIRGQGEEWIFSFGGDETINVLGPLGETIVKLNQNHVWIDSSPCSNQTCVAVGLITRQGQWAACLPNNVLLIIKGAKDDYIDAIVW